MNVVSRRYWLVNQLWRQQSVEAHHGVRISDAAIITAAQLSDRYITARFLPDKAIDLIDEAAATRRVQLDSRPEKIDVLERRIMQLEIECTALGINIS